VWWSVEFDDESVVVAWDRGLVEDSSAVQYGQGRTTVGRTSDEHVINTAKANPSRSKAGYLVRR
jgi:hypothetical protein